MKYLLTINNTTMRNKIKYTLLILLTVISINTIAQDFPKKSNPPRIVNDYANFLSVQENQALENKLVQFNNQTSTQIAIVIVKSLDGYDPFSYANGLGENWGIGQKGKDNGILILVKPKYQNSKGEVFIATGYGVEGAVPDAITKRIVNNEIIPYFKQGMYFKGLDEATNRIIELTKGEYTAEQYREATKRSGSGSAIPGGVIFLIIIVFSFIGRARRARHYSVGHSVPFWIAMGMMSSNRSHGGSYGNFSSGGGSFGGGFGGFGGGSFGGGGAGGSW
jgi:uncharacterized protein